MLTKVNIQRHVTSAYANVLEQINVYVTKELNMKT